LAEWEPAGARFKESTDAEGFKLVGESLEQGIGNEFYRVNLTLDPGPLAGPSISALTGSSRFGFIGDISWEGQTGSPNLVSASGTAGQTGRIVVEVHGPRTVRFTMSIASAGAGDSFAFYIDGARVAVTRGEVLEVEQTLDGDHLLMWEYVRGTGQAVLAPITL
jgi:hypothetical protein